MTWKLNPLTVRKLNRFRSIKRGYWSFIALAVALLISLFGELLVNDQALMVRYNGNWYFPALVSAYPVKWIYTPKEFRSGKFFGSPVAADGKIYCAEARGKIVVLRGDGVFEVLAENNLGEQCHSTPAIANGVMYVRTYQTLFAISK